MTDQERDNDRPLKGGGPTPPADEARTMDLGPVPASAELAARYDVLGELGSGGMGIVYKARDRETGDVVALKVLRPEISGRPELIERFKSELLLARKITHKNVCRTHELLRFGATVAIAMEYVEGESLRAVLNRSQGVSIRYGLGFLRQALAGLAEAHAQGMVHRDLKPENILIARDGTVKVMDFGIARSLETGATATGAILGTPAYMSPEQAEGKPADARSDIYSLGLIMYEVFTGAQAFRAETPVALAMKQVRETPPLPRERDPHLPMFLDRAIQKCLEKNPTRRFQSVEDLEAALIEKGEPKVAAAGEEAELPLNLTRWQQSDWWLVLAAAAGLALFFPFFNRTSPAPRTKIMFDRGALGRIAEEFAQRLGAPRAGNPKMQHWWVGAAHDYVARHSGAQAALELTNNPVPYWVWNIVWDDGTRVGMDHRGSLVSFSRNFPREPVLPSPSLEEARLLAEKNLREFFGGDPSHLSLDTAPNGAWGGQRATLFTWADPRDYHGLKHRYSVRLVGSQTASLEESYDTPEGYEWPVEREKEGWQVLPCLGLILILLILGISQRRLVVEHGARWRIAFVGGFFLMGVYFGLLATKQNIGGVGSIVVTVFMAVAFAFLAFFHSVAFERSVRRAWPGKLSSLVRLFDRMGAVQPYPGKLVIAVLECLLLVWALSRFDVLTVMLAAFTFAFCWANYYLLVMFEPTGALEQWVAFAVFGLFVAAAAAIAFKSPLRQAYGRIAAAIE